jgi:sialic acid synthase SpsE
MPTIWLNPKYDQGGRNLGLSDHTMGIGTSIAAVAFGARVIEKHFTLRRKDGGVDSVFSIEPGELKSLVSETENAFLSIGDIKFGILETEKNSLSFKRSLYVVKNVKKGEMFTTQNLRVIRPGDGLPPKFFESVLGKSATTGIKAGTPLTWDMI